MSASADSCSPSKPERPCFTRPAARVRKQQWLTNTAAGVKGTGDRVMGSVNAVHKNYSRPAAKVKRKGKIKKKLDFSGIVDGYPPPLS